VKWWITAWQLVKDILLTGTGLVLILMQALHPQPSGSGDPLLWTGLALTLPAATSKIIALWSAPSEAGHGAPESSLSAHSQEEPESPSSSSEDTDE
jgi:hypothetical protein